MKSCRTCRWHRLDLECFLNHCEHPSLITHDKTKGPQMPHVEIAMRSCNLTLWEKPRTFCEWILSKRKQPPEDT
jgi:hypothetical protein